MDIDWWQWMFIKRIIDFLSDILWEICFVLQENVANVSKISVKERSQKFDRMASESALNKVSLPNNANGNSNKKKHDKVSAASFSIGAPLLDYFEAVNMVAK